MARSVEIVWLVTDGPDIRNRWKSFCEDLYRRNNNISSELPNASYENVELEPSPLYSEIEKASQKPVFLAINMLTVSKSSHGPGRPYFCTYANFLCLFRI